MEFNILFGVRKSVFLRMDSHIPFDNCDQADDHLKRVKIVQEHNCSANDPGRVKCIYMMNYKSLKQFFPVTNKTIINIHKKNKWICVHEFKYLLSNC